MSDLIDRQAAIDALVKAIREDPYYDSNEAINGLGVCDVRVILNDLPSAQPEQQWIPKKPIEKPEKYSKDVLHLYCPSCENWIGIWNNRVKHGDMYNNSNKRICPYCGQAIDCEWMEEQENR